MSGFVAQNDNEIPPPAERRRDRRRRVLFKGKIVYLDSSFSTDCAINDISPGGARITVDPQAISAEPFLIVVRDAVVHPSRTAWYVDGQAGLQFQGAVKLGEDVPPAYRAVQRLWAALTPR